MNVTVSALIVVLSYNHPEHTASAVRSALRLSGNVALVHNGSEKRHVETVQKLFPQITHWIIESNRGYSGGMNEAFKRGFEKHDWLILLTNDCELLSLPDLPPTPALIAPLILKRKSEKIDSLGGAFNPKTGHLSHCRSQEEFAAQARAYVPGSAFALHRKVYEDVGGFDEALGTYWEDVDYSQVVKTKFSLLTDANWKIRHKIGKTCHKDPRYTIYFYQRNRKRVSFRYARVLNKPGLAVHLAYSWIKLGYRLVRTGRTHDLKLLLAAVRD